MLKQVALLSVVAITFTGCVVAPFDDGRYHSNQYGYANQYGYSGQYGGHTDSAMTQVSVMTVHMVE